MADEITVRVTFRANTKHGEFCDSLNLTETEWMTLTPEQIAAMKQTRVDNWVTFMDGRVAEPKPTKAELESQHRDMVSIITDLEEKKTKLEAEIATKNG